MLETASNSAVADSVKMGISLEIAFMISGIACASMILIIMRDS